MSHAGIGIGKKLVAEDFPILTEGRIDAVLWYNL
jgi:hypothetical protein